LGKCQRAAPKSDSRNHTKQLEVFGVISRVLVDRFFRSDGSHYGRTSARCQEISLTYITSVHSLEHPEASGEHMGDFARLVHAKRNPSPAIFSNKQEWFHLYPAFPIAR
jgi:hypothetical protein